MVSLIIPCRNEGSYLQHTLRSLIEAKTELSYEIIVVNDGSTDGCCNFLEQNNSGSRPGQNQEMFNINRCFLKQHGITIKTLNSHLP
ncbi:MAG: glycosyltransferase [Armatimonadetes bacterium]|nr:glycosyltransferase [Armatimonadota bacterium]